MSVDDVTWRHGAIGSPDPGAGSTQALVAGLRITPERGGRRYQHHAGAPPSIFLCEQPAPPLER